MNTIQFGNLQVPVLAEVVLTGAPSSGGKADLVQRTARLSNKDLFDNGVITGTSEGDSNPQGQTSYSQEQILHGGRVSLGDSSEFIVSEPTASGSGDYPNKVSNVSVVHQEDQTTIDIYTSGNGTVVPLANVDQTNSTNLRYCSISAIAFTYDGATTDPGRVKGYCIYVMSYHYRIYYSTGTVYSEYGKNISWTINLPYWNIQYDLSMSFNEIIPPEPEPDPFDPSEDDPYPDTPPSPDSSDTINIPNNPTIGVSGAGFIHIYNPPLGYLQSLGDILFPQLSPPSDIVDAIAQLYTVIANQNLINYVIDCHVIPVTPQTGTNENIKVGYRDTGISVPKVTSDYIDATCGSLSIPEYFHGFQDYMATKSKIYLPFIGFVDTKPEYWQAGTISVDYKFNVIDGSFMAYIRAVSSKSALNGSVIAQYAGNACMHFPLTGVNYANMVSGIIGAAAGAISQGTGAAFLGGAWSAANTIAQGGNVQQSNGYNSTAALLGVREAFLLIERPVPAYPAGYGHNKGFPSNITTQLANVRGYTEISDIDLTGLPFTADEIEELRTLLSEGVYF